MANLDFSKIIHRLMSALGLKHEYELAERLEFKKDSFSARKLRNSVPVDKIRLLCKEERINIDWALYGEGEMSVVAEEGPIYETGLLEIEKKWMDRIRRMPLEEKQRRFMELLEEENEKLRNKK